MHVRRAGARVVAFVHNKYGSEQKLKEAWSDYPRMGESWQNIHRPTFGSSERRFRDEF
ncbi:MAG: hypothetical protein RMK29_14710 [Myxococcales bacterium]|nr:hypothetical protein [Myxococcales bacterium]